MKNPIIEELHKVREKLLADSGGTLDDLVDRLQAEEKKSNQPRFERRQTEPKATTEIAADNQSSSPADR